MLDLRVLNYFLTVARTESITRAAETLHIAASYNLAYNASLMVADNMGIRITLRGIINVSGDSPLAFRPLSPPLSDRLHIVWKRHAIFTRAARAFLEELRKPSAKD